MSELPLARPLERTVWVAVRQQVPFSWRVAVRRIPALARWPLRPRPLRRDLPVVVAERSSPLRRPATTYEEAVQQGKETNVRRVASLLDRVWIGPGEVFSWNHCVGPPLARRGFVAGPELHEGAMALGLGGGACQVANLVFWLGVMGGMQVLERHRHQWDLFPDDRRAVPFGCGATVFWPHRDLVLRNPHPFGLALGTTVDGTHLRGAIRSERALPERYHLVETAHRFVEHRGAIWRCNTVSRVAAGPRGEHAEVLVHNTARVAYRVPSEQIWRS